MALSCHIKLGTFLNCNNRNSKVNSKQRINLRAKKNTKINSYKFSHDQSEESKEESWSKFIDAINELKSTTRNTQI